METTIPAVSFSGHRLRMLRTDKRLNQTELARVLDVAPGTVRDWESERFSPTVAMVCKIAETLGCPVGELFEDTRGVIKDGYGNVSGPRS
jgi:transcriptional regulator with XRE-family HTH domain